MPDEGRFRRLFIGLALDERARAACAAVAERLQATGFPAKYEDVDKLHVTLAFLGNVESARCQAIADTLAGAVLGPPFELTLDRVGAFPHERKARLTYVGARHQGAAFRRLAAGVRDAYRRIGFTFDDDAVAHVTIARAKEPRPLPMLDVEPIGIGVEAVSLFESLFDKAKRTSRYEVLLDRALR
jgi:2'-5' RNA ligase